MVIVAGTRLIYHEAKCGSDHRPLNIAVRVRLKSKLSALSRTRMEIEITRWQDFKQKFEEYKSYKSNTQFRRADLIWRNFKN